ncbi:hypothetical protein [Chenggangzhangella methanolivorans]|uniref:Uncharacterized protein n=1 Tax=Chenggangzhangella methanolivorans TaxID=1437009 RepID=A0A9E6R9P5_9HYPH|nr:hypothetical protein [Chenggangzhangella methanolivorans]QZO00370.1 hypothetical protein K6K41_00865 [Chenggangzhangella methanolivorans]
MSRIPGQALWGVMAAFALAATAMDLGRWGAEHNAAGHDLLAAVPVAMLAAATLVAYAVACVGGPSRNAYRIASFGAAVVLVGYVLLARSAA